MFQFSVVESYRDNGKVKHRTLLYLTSIPEIFLDSPQWAKDFLGMSEYKLKNLPDTDKASLMAKLRTYVSRADEAKEESIFQAVWRRDTTWWGSNYYP